MQVQLNYFQDEDRFLREVRERRKKSSTQSSLFILSRLRMLGLMLGCVNLIFQEELLQLLPVEGRYKLVYSKERNDP